ncbi:unnamed protein product [Schistosoma margrebowiei]|uniref:Uncharacterized protein n=1 Tax=Schistosoma margrebowiei TaxID=48269 RepID=A0A183LEH1_9TREM|nr:unnamed protein product [Schistosoma margrebowiei]
MAVSVVGFDIGSLTSYIGVARGGGVEVITNEYSERATPFTRLLGKCLSDSSVVNERKFMTHQVESTRDGRITLSVSLLILLSHFFKAFLKGQKTPFAPEQILAIQMNKLKDIAETTIGSKVVDVVVNVPTYFTDAERRSVLDATKVAGLNCVKLVNDITANLPPADQQPKIVAFVSVGYSTTQGSLSSKATIRLLQECEKLKKSMSANSSELPINVESLAEDRDLANKMKRTDFEELCSDLLERFQMLFTKCLDVAKLKSGDVHSVELIGGCSRIPMIKNVVASVFKQEGKTSLNADEAVARGCAFQAAICSPAFKVKDFTVVEQCLYPIIIQFDQEEGSEQCMQTEEIDGTLTTQGKNMCIEVFPFLHPIPSSRQIVLLRHGVFTLEARYANKDSLPNQNIVIGTFRIGDASQVFTEPRKIKLKMRMNTHGIFNISQAQLVEEYEKEVEVNVSEDNPVVDGPPNSKQEVTTASNGDTDSQNPPVDSNQTEMQDSTSPKKKTVMKKKKFTKYHDLSIEVSNMQFTTKQLNEFCEIGANLIQQDKLERERVNSKNAVEEYVYEMRSKLQGPLNPFASPAESESLLQLLDMTEEWLYGDGESLKRHVYVEKLAELRSKGDPIVHRANEHLNRPLAVDNFNRSLVRIRKVLDSIAAGEPTYDHLTQAQVNQLEDTIVQYETWLNQQMVQQNPRPQTSDPVVKVTDIVSQQQAMESVCHPIINTPKPPTASHTNNTPDLNSQNSGQSNDVNNPNTNCNPGTNHSKKGADDEQNMDLD